MKKDTLTAMMNTFGSTQDEKTRTLLETHRLRMLVKPYGVAKMEASESQISVQFDASAPIDPMKIITLIQKDKHTKMSGPDKLVRKIATPDLKARVAAVKALLDAVKA